MTELDLFFVEVRSFQVGNRVEDIVLSSFPFDIMEIC